VSRYRINSPNFSTIPHPSNLHLSRQRDIHFQCGIEISVFRKCVLRIQRHDNSAAVYAAPDVSPQRVSAEMYSGFSRPGIVVLTMSQPSCVIPARRHGPIDAIPPREEGTLNGLVKHFRDLFFSVMRRERRRGPNSFGFRCRRCLSPTAMYNTCPALANQLFVQTRTRSCSPSRSESQ